MKHKTIYVLLIFSVLVTGCATSLSKEGHSVQAADERMVANCTFLGEVQGSSGWGNLAASQGMQNARNEAQEEAAKLGATHVVWMNIAGGYSPFAVGRAYKCS
jgi:hypothetical protein